MKITKKSLVAGIMTLSLAFAFAMPVVVGAAATPPEEESGSSLDEVPNISIFKEDGINLGDATLTYLIQSLIKIFLAFLGVIAVLIILYGGFLWMTASGEPDKVEKAKKLIYAGITGLIIIFASYAIATFVIDAMQGITGGNAITT